MQATCHQLVMNATSHRSIVDSSGIAFTELVMCTCYLDYAMYTDQLSISVTPTNPVIGERGAAQFTATASGVNMKKLCINGGRNVLIVFLIRCLVLMEQC